MPQSRRRFLASVTGSIGSLLLSSRQAAALVASGGPHPEPRPGIDASRVLAARQLADTPDVIPSFDKIRRIPRIADGIRCQCECRELPGFRSLLVCFEGAGMARHCGICQAQAKLAYDLHRAGRSLNQIRLAIDEEFG